MNNDPRDLYLESVELLKVSNPIALDIAAGALNETKDMIKRSFEVTAIDYNPGIVELAKEIGSTKLKAINSTMEDFAYGVNKYDYIIAMFALPFISPNKFDEVFAKITKSLKPDGVFALHLFGNKDEWAGNPKMSIFDVEGARNLIKDLSILKFKEIEKPTRIANGQMKRGHIFQIIVQK